MFKLFSIVFVISLIFVIIYLIRSMLLENKTITQLKALGKKYMNVESSIEDIPEWNKYIPILESIYLAKKKNMESTYFAIKNIFNKYLLYHYPNDYRVDSLGLSIEEARKYNYKELLLINLNEVQFIIEKNEYENMEYCEILSSLKKVISSSSKLYVTESNNVTFDKLITLVNEIKKNIHENTQEEIEWHTKINKLLAERGNFISE